MMECDKNYGRSFNNLALVRVLFSHVLYQLSYLGLKDLCSPLVRMGPGAVS